MQSPLNFDTLEFMKHLKESGMTQDQAEIFTRALSEALDQMMSTQQLATKTDLCEVESRLKGFMVRCVTTSIIMLGGIQLILHFFKT